MVYVETPVDTDKDGQLDLVKVTILRPNVDFPVPAMMTASPYQQGTNEPASDKLTHKMEGDLLVKPAGEISLSQPEIKDTRGRPYAYQSCHKRLRSVLLTQIPTRLTITCWLVVWLLSMYRGVGTFNF